MKRSLFSTLAIAAAAFTLCTVTAPAQDFARLPMRIVAATPAGGAADVNARRIADRLSRALKQSVIVQNVAGGAGNIAAATIADATPNGNSMLFVAHPVLAVNPLLYTKLPFNAERDFQPVVLLSKTPHVLRQATDPTALATISLMYQTASASMVSILTLMPKVTPPNGGKARMHLSKPSQARM